MREEIVRFQNVTMSVSGDRYLDNMNFYMLKGEIMGFIASRGKGRDEFIELLCKNLPIEYGRIYMGGRQVNSFLHSPGDENRVYCIGKKSSLIESLSLTDNVFVIRKGFKKLIVNDQVLRRQIIMLSEELGLFVSLDKSVKQFTSLERCEVEILKAYMMGCRLIVVTDLSEFMSQRELEQFHRRLTVLKEKGMSFLYVCNHHEEAFKISDRVSLYSSGRIKKVFEKEEMTDAAIAPYIMKFDELTVRRRAAEVDTKLEFKEVSAGRLRGLSFHIKGGECLTVLDTDNRAQEEIVRIMAGETPILSGDILYEGRHYRPDREKDFLKSGIAVIPENPTKTFLFQEQSYMENLTFLLDRKLDKNILKNAYIKSVRREYEELSKGGVDAADLQKLTIRQRYGLVYFRVLLYRPRLAILVQPVAYGDMICRRYILELINMLKEAGITVLILAGSISDNLYVSDRLVVLKDGKTVGEFAQNEFERITNI